MIVQIKLNQRNLFNEVSNACQQTNCIDKHDSGPEKSRNRIEERTTEIFVVDKYLDKSREWNQYIDSVAKVTRKTERLDLKTKEWKPSLEVSYYGLTHRFSAKNAAYYIRGHWGIENSNHYVRDVSLDEDASRIRTSPGIVARLRSFALNILRTNNVSNIKGELYENALSFDRIIAYKGGLT